MSEETLLDPQLAGQGGSQIVNAAQDAGGALPALAARIHALCAAVPWGRDEAGRACDRAFSSIPATVDAVGGSVGEVMRFGQDIQVGVARTVDADTAARDRVVAAAVSNNALLP